jgi:hypothetical protein
MLSFIKEGVFKLSSCEVAGVDRKQSLKIKIPSGKLVIANDLRFLLKEDEDEEYRSVNSYLGRVNNSKYYSDSHGCIYYQLGNESPSIFKHLKKDSLTLKSETLFDNEKDNEVKNYTSDEVNCGYVCTDLWAFMAMDFDDFTSHCESLDFVVDEIVSDFDVTVVDMEAGLYEVVSYYETGSQEKDGVFAEFKLINQF